MLRGSGKDYVPKDNQPIPDEDKELSSVLLKLKDPQAGFNLDYTINKQGKVATLAWPIGRVMADLFNRLGWMSRILVLVAYLVMMVAACSILAALHNTMRERRREFAILRALGAAGKPYSPRSLPKPPPSPVWALWEATWFMACCFSWPQD